MVNERILHKAGYNVLYAADGEEALRLARQAIPDIVLLEMLLPKLGGREVMQALRAHLHPPRRSRCSVFSGLPQSNEEKLKKEGACRLLPEVTIDRQKATAKPNWLGLIERLLQESKGRRRISQFPPRTAVAGGRWTGVPPVRIKPVRIRPVALTGGTPVFHFQRTTIFTSLPGTTITFTICLPAMLALIFSSAWARARTALREHRRAPRCGRAACR